MFDTLRSIFKEKKSARQERKVVQSAASKIDDVGAILGALAEPILVLDHQRIVKYATQQAVDVFGRYLQQRHIVQCIRHPHVIEAIEDVFATQKVWTGEAQLLTPVERHVTFHLAPVGEGEGIVVTVRDTTLMKRTEEMHTDFVANVSHELRSPLSAILGFIETLQGPAQDDKDARVRFLSIMIQEANRMARLIDDLLSLSRVQIQEHVAPEGTINVTRILQNVVDILSLEAENRGMSLKLDLHRDVFVAGDEDQIMQVFQNLVGNAIKYGREKTDVEISYRLLERMPDRKVPAVAVDVRDQGEGIAEEHLSRLTERFYRVDKARSRTMGGTGLGLAIVKHILTRHRGRLMVDSKVGYGSVFTAILPSIDSEKEHVTKL